MARATLDIYPLFEAAKAFIAACNAADIEGIGADTPAQAPMATADLHRATAVLCGEAAAVAHAIGREHNAVPEPLRLIRPGEG